MLSEVLLCFKYYVFISILIFFYLCNRYVMKMLLLRLMQTLNGLTTWNPWMWNLFIAGVFISFQKAAFNDSSSKVTFKIRALFILVDTEKDIIKILPIFFTSFPQHTFVTIFMVKRLQLCKHLKNYYLYHF